MKLLLTDGREIELKELHQRLTYEGRLEGVPTRRGNAKYVERLIAEQKVPGSGAFHLLTPEERPVPWDDPQPYPFGEPATLPRVTCKGRFTSVRPARDDQKDYSQLTIIWLQDAYALPLSEAAASALKALDWTALADDHEY